MRALLGIQASFAVLPPLDEETEVDPGDGERIPGGVDALAQLRERK